MPVLGAVRQQCFAAHPAVRTETGCLVRTLSGAEDPLERIIFREGSKCLRIGWRLSIPVLHR
jgi:hypothetical protein